MPMIRKIFIILICTILFINIISLGIKNFENEFFFSNGSKNDHLKGNGVLSSEIPVCGNNHNNHSGFNFKLQETGAEEIEDYIDKISDIDNIPDIGMHNIFDELKAVDHNYDTLTEINYITTNTTLIEAESFEGYTFPPSGWEKTANSQWARELDTAKDGTYSADFDGVLYQTVSGNLTSKIMDCSDADRIYIDFWWRDEGLDYDDFLLEFYDGNNWDVILDFNQLSQPEYQWNLYSEEITDTQYFISNFKIRWHVKSISGYEHAYIDLVTVKKGINNVLPSYQLDLEVQFTNVINFLYYEELCIKTGLFGGSEYINVSYWDGGSWQLIVLNLLPNEWNNFTIALTTTTFTIKFGGSNTFSDSTQDWWEIDTVLLKIKDQDEIWENDYGFIWLDTPDEVDLGTTYGSWVFNQDLSDDSVPSNAIGVALAWVETDTYSGQAVARGSEDKINDYMNGGSSYCEIEGETWRMQMVKLGDHKYIDTWRGSSLEKLYVMGYTIGTDPRFKTEASNLGTLIADSNWHDMTVNELDENTTGIILFGQISSFSDTTLLVRAVGSTDNMIYREWEEYNCGLLFVKVDNNDKFQYYVSSGSSAELYLIAEVGESIDWLDANRDDISATSIGWNTVDLDTYITVPLDISGVIFQFETTRTSDTEYDYNNIAREYSQTWNFPFFEVGGDQWLMGGSGVDSEHKVEIYAESTRADVYIHALTRYVDKTPPEIINFGVDDPGNGTGIFWANLTDDGSIVANVTLKIASIEYEMSFNGTYWVNTSHPIIYSNNYNYRIVNASDIFGNKITSPSNTQWYEFAYDIKAPKLIPADKYYFYSVDSFKVNITNTWGIGIDTVIINGTKIGESNYYFAVMVNYENYSDNTIEGYINNTLSSDAGWQTEDIINYTIFVNDTAGNYFISDYFQGYIFTNSPPSAENLVYNPSPLYSNSTLFLSYDWNDPDLYSIEGASEIRWYKKPYGDSIFYLEPLHNDSKQISAYYLFKGDEWYATVKPKDGEDFGSLVNESSESTIIVINTPPSITGFSWQENEYYTIDNISFTFIFVDDDPSDSEVENDRIVYWFLNGIKDSRFDNLSFIPYLNTTKTQNWSVQIIVFDGTNYSNIYSLSNITILNSPPEVDIIVILPSFPYSYQQLNASWHFIDFDNDTERIESSIIIWYKNGIYQPKFDNNSIIPSNETIRGENWQFKCWVTDGSNYSTSEFWSIIITIENSKPQVSDITINSGITPIYTNNNLVVTYLFEDFDEFDVEVDKIIQWYLFDEIQSDFTDLSTISSINTSKGQEWTVSITVKDNAGSWSEIVNSSPILIANSLPSVLIHSNNHPEFIIDDENLEIKENYYTFIDVDMDFDKSIIHWYRNEIYQPNYKNKIIPASVTNPGEAWYYILTPFDGQDNGTSSISPIIIIESKPIINSYNFVPINDTEGHYELELNITDTRNDIKQVEFYISLNSSENLPPFIITSPRSGFPNLWVLNYILSNYSYLDTIIFINVIIVTEVVYSVIKYEITLQESFNFTIRDTAPPRIINAWFEQNNEPNPTNISFFAEVEELGSGISEIIISYYFLSANNGAGEGSSIIGQNYSKMMQYNGTSTGYFLYSTTIGIKDYTTNLKIVYWISSKDNNGNINKVAFNNLSLADQNIIYQPPGLPQWILLVSIVIIVFIFISSIIYVKFIRKPEIRGLDKELVLEGISKITEAEIKSNLDAHTIGIILSFFDQRHGPIPILSYPDILNDNWDKLVGLSDRSFSGTQFSDNFETEVISVYDFLLERELRVSVMSFGFSLERSDARGGQENITENILINKEIYPLLNQFQEEIQVLVHKTHIMMSETPTEKERIIQSIYNLRSYITAIVLSYQSIYGTIEFFEEN